MSGAPAHVGECPVMTFTRWWSDNLPIVNQPWERFMVVDNDLLIKWDLRDVKWRSDGMFIELAIRCANGQARYRKVGNGRTCTVWELVEGEYRDAERESGVPE